MCSKTQSIYHGFLPQSCNGESPLDKNIDYGLAFRPESSGFASLYQQTSMRDNICLCQMNDLYTEKMVLMAGLEVKPARGAELEATVQLALWLAAGLSCRSQLLAAVGTNAKAMDTVPLLGWTVVGHEWKLYMAYMDKTEHEQRVVVSSG